MADATDVIRRAAANAGFPEISDEEVMAIWNKLRPADAQFARGGNLAQSWQEGEFLKQAEAAVRELVASRGDKGA